MLVVLSIVAILTATAFAVARPQAGHGRLLLAVRDLQADIRRARQDAQEQNAPTEIRFNLREGSWSATDGTQHRFPKNTVVNLTVASFGDEDSGNARIRFYPDGSSTGGDIEITGGASKYQISVDWLTGRTALAEPQ
jgi:general secretion pathway protein H